MTVDHANRAFRIALVDPRYRQRSAEVTAGHGDVRSSDSTYAPFALAVAGRREGERNRKMSAGTVSRAREACPRSRVRTRLCVEQMWVQHQQYTRSRPERVMSFVPRGNSVLHLRQSALITIAILARTIAGYTTDRAAIGSVFVAERLHNRRLIYKLGRINTGISPLCNAEIRENMYARYIDTRAIRRYS